MNGLEALETLPAWGIAAIAALVVVQIALDVIALRDLYKRPVEQLTMMSKWVWVAIILLINTFGAVIYLLIGRKPAIAEEVAPAASTASRAARAADALYGSVKDIES